MSRSQLYLVTLTILFFLFSLLLARFMMLEREFRGFEEYISNILVLKKVKNFNSLYSKLRGLEGSEILPFYVYYDCSASRVIIPNYFGSINVKVFNELLEPLNSTVSNSSYISFVPEGKEYMTGKCYFRGYIVKNSKFNTRGTISGKKAYLTVFNELAKITLDSSYLSLINYIEKDFKVVLYDKETRYYNNYFDIILRSG